MMMMMLTLVSDVVVMMMMMMMMKTATCRLAGEFSCLQPAAGTLLTKCSKFLRFAVMMFFLFCYVLLLYCLIVCFIVAHQVLKIPNISMLMSPGKSCPKTLGSSVTLIERTLRHSRYFSIIK